MNRKPESIGNENLANEFRKCFEQSPLWPSCNVTVNDKTCGVSLSDENDMPTNLRCHNLKMDFNFGCNSIHSTLLSGDIDQILDTLKNGFLVELNTSMPSDCWSVLKSHFSNQYLKGGDLESLASSFMSFKSSNIRLNLKKDKLQHFIERNFSGAESLNFVFSLLMNTLTSNFMTSTETNSNLDS